VLVGRGLLAGLGDLIARVAPAHRYALVTDDAVGPPPRRPRPGGAAGRPPVRLSVPSGEAFKTRESWARLTDELLASGAGRDTTVLRSAAASSATSPASCRRHVHARGAGDPAAHHPARHDRRLGGRQDRRRYTAGKTSWAPSIRRPPSWPTSKRSPRCLVSTLRPGSPRRSSMASSPIRAIFSRP
jgi:hypothetical protein